MLWVCEFEKKFGVIIEYSKIFGEVKRLLGLVEYGVWVVVWCKDELNFWLVGELLGNLLNV